MNLIIIFLSHLFILFSYIVSKILDPIYAKTSIKSLLLFIWKCRPNISSGLTVQFPYLENSAQGECWKWGGLGFSFFFFIQYFGMGLYMVERMKNRREERSSFCLYILLCRDVWKINQWNQMGPDMNQSNYRLTLVILQYGEKKFIQSWWDKKNPFLRSYLI